MISRKKFIERIRLSHESEAYLHRPIIQALLNWVKVKPLELPESCKIHEAVERALRRPREIVYEPVVITFKNADKRLLDLQVLLLAYSQIFTLVNKTVQRQQLQLQGYLEKFQQEHTKAKRYYQALETQKNSVQEHNQLSESQQTELRQQAEKFAQINQRFTQVGQLLSSEGTHVFQATQEMVNAIHYNTDHLVAISKMMAKELETMHNASDLIKQVGKQSQFLGLHTAILANRFNSSELDGFSRVASEVAQLSNQTLEAGRRMSDTANRLRSCIEDLVKLAQGEAGVVQVLVQKVSRAKAALTELEKLLEHEDLQSLVSSTSKAEETSNDPTIQPISRKGELVDVTLAESDRLSEYRDLYTLIRTVEQKLEQSKKIVSKEWQ
ncbi:MAG: methyl-accepting chemotaxis protein [Leptolyngbyaceae cyanobacterium RU_5_1]|nr:methyl-accepting chemotaxis protein [Leptolyngbyaceae cyanobacterium RU_5_1]